jgi:hypothetical protein
MGEKPDPGSGMNIPDYFLRALKQVLVLKILKFFDADPDLGFGVLLALDPAPG